MKATRWLFVLLALGWLLATAALGAPPLPGASEIEDQHNVVYGQVGGRALHIEISLPKARPAAPMPAVLWIHGGGWQGGSHVGNPARPLAAHGYFTGSIEYRLSGEAKWPAQIEDCKLAVRWLRANAAAYGVDPNHIGVWGQSAGGHLACCLATMDESAGFDTEGGYPGVSSRVQAVLDWSGPTDFVTGRNTYAWALGPLFGDPAALKDDDRLRRASPLTWVRAGDPPFLIVHGDCDSIVPYAESVRLKAALDRVGVSAELLTVHGGEHTYQAMPGGPKPVPDGAAIAAAGFAFFERILKPNASAPKQPT